MPVPVRWMLVPVVLAGALLAGPATAALVAEVKDDAGFFGDEAVRKANRTIKEIKERTKHDLVIETYPTVPKDRAAEFKGLSREERDRFFDRWARERARDLEVNGVYVLITREPGHLQVEVGNETQKKAFTLQDRRKLRTLLLERFKEKRYDQGLLEATEFVRQTMGEHLGRAEARPGERSRRAASEAPAGEAPGRRFNFGGLLCIGLAVLAGVWLFMGVVRAMGGMGGGGVGGPGYGYGGGGGFMSGLMGGLFGAVAGSWMYDHFFRGDSGGGWGDSSAAGAGPDVSQPQDTDYSGEGGDFGDAGGSDSAGGGDFGGGDFGGGDFGGGGDF